jgi:serine/threonine protein kinase
VLTPVAADDRAASANRTRFGSLMAVAIEAAEGRCEPAIRRSRHATTYHLQLDGGGRKVDFFVKVYRRPKGLEPLRRLLRRSRIDHAIKIGTELRNHGFCVAPILIRGANLGDGRSMLVTARAEGVPLADVVATLAVDRKRRWLERLGEEVARLHRAGFIHGDLTPYNIFITQEPARFTFIDNDRTRRTRPIRAGRQRLRNFVQLGRFDLAGVTRADRIRVLRAYASALGLRNWHSLRNRAAAMLGARMDRDRLKPDSHPNAQPALPNR